MKCSIENMLIATGMMVSVAAIAAPELAAERVVIVHTNDTHSQIDPDRQTDAGGALRRQVLIDSIRAAEPYTIVVDAGDAVQGSLYYTLFKGEVEQRMLNELGYDVQILGNHEYDNGLEILAENYQHAIPTVISANTTFEGTPMEGLVQPYVIKQVGNRRIAFIGVNVKPDGLISPAKSRGVGYEDGVTAVNRVARHIRETSHVDAIVALTHIGYTGSELQGCKDVDIAARCPEVDVVIGGHTHTLLTPGEPRTLIPQCDGDTTLVVQVGKWGHNVGEVVLDFAPDGTMTKSWRRMAVDSRLDPAISPTTEAVLAPYRTKVDSIYAIQVTNATADFDHQAMMNFTADFLRSRAAQLKGAGKIDLAIMNKGGIRRDFVAGPLTRGNIIDVFPFDNRIVVVDIKGDSLQALFGVLASQWGQGISSNVTADINPDHTACSTLLIDGQPVDPKRTYRLATIDYLAEGGDNMSQLTTAREIARSRNVLYDDVINYLGHRREPLAPDPTIRMK